MTPQPRKKSRLWLWLLLVLLVAGGAGAAAGWQKFRPKPLTVQTEKVARRNITELVTATGKIQPVLQVKISPEVAGEIIELGVKEGQSVHKGDLLVKIKPDYYRAIRDSAEASFRSAESGLVSASANLSRASSEFQRVQELAAKKLISGTDFDTAKNNKEVAAATEVSSRHQIEMARQSLKKAEEDLLKCTIYSPIDGTVSKLISEVGERVVGTGMMAGTEIMTVADLNEMEARVEVGEVDVVLVRTGQKARLEVDSFRDRKFGGVITQIANSAKTQGVGTQQEATKFEVRIRVTDRERFLPGMSVTAELETRYRTNVLTVPIQCVTTRLPKGVKKEGEVKKPDSQQDKDLEQDFAALTKKKEKVNPAVDVVFSVKEGKAQMLPVKRGISDDGYYEIESGVTEDTEVVTGSYKAIARELEDGKAALVDNTKKKSASEPAK